MTKFGDVLTTDDIPTGGTTILNGTGPPADALGAVGNYYLDTVAKILYGPKASATLYGPDQVAVTSSPASSTTAGSSTLGSKFKVLVAGRVTGLRFWRINNASAYSVTMALFLQSTVAELGRTAAVSVPSGSTAGWVIGSLASPIAVAAGTDYRVGYSTSPTSSPASYTSSFTPTSAIPAVITVSGNCTGTGVLVYPDTDSTLCFFADVVFQAALGLWPIALKSAP